MGLEIREMSNGRMYYKLITCPACGHEFGDGANPEWHIYTHDPSDFGL